MNFAFIFPMQQLWFWAAIGIALVACAACALRYFDRRRDSRLHRMIAAHLAPRLAPGADRALRIPLFWYAILAVAFLLLALAQPHWGASWQDVRKVSRELLIVLDTSESMRADDVQPSRLDRAKQKIYSILEEAPADRVGLIAFSGAAELQSPVTVDHGYYKAVLAAVDTNTISLEGSNLEAALREAANVFMDDDETRSMSGRANRAVLLISDGEEVSGAALEAARELAHYGRVFVMGVGTEKGAAVALPEWYARFVGAGNAASPHHSALNPEILARIALEGDGIYVTSTRDNTDIDRFMARFETVAARGSDDRIRYQLVNRYQWPLAIGILFVAAEGVWIAIMPLLRRLRSQGRGAELAEENRYA